MLWTPRSKTLTLVISFAFAIAAMSDLAAAQDTYRTRAGGRYPLPKNMMRQQAQADAIPEDAEIADDTETDDEPVGTGVKSSVRQAAFVSPAAAPNRYRSNMASHRGGFVPGHQRVRGEFVSQGDESFAAMETAPEEVRMPIGEQVIEEGEFADEYYGPRFRRRPFGIRQWGDDCGNCCLIPCPRFGYFEAFAGAHGFTGPLNRGTGSFGFQEGLNVGMPLICNLTGQVGVMGTQSNFEGAPFTPDDRTQFFLTAGAFRRVDLGLQAGVVIDYLHDDWDYSVDLTQIRGELSWLMPCNDELGFWFAAGSDQTTTSGTLAVLGNNTITLRTADFEVEPTDIFAFFYRRQLACGGEGRVFGGFTDDNRGLIGGNIRLPMNCNWQFTTDFLYVVADDNSQTAFLDENWNVSFNLVWAPQYRGGGGCQNYCRPLFDVANNGSFLTRFR